MDCTWFTTIVRNECFSVRGHFRLQPQKDNTGNWTKELIYINEFQKHGYIKSEGFIKLVTTRRVKAPANRISGGIGNA